MRRNPKAPKGYYKAAQEIAANAIWANEKEQVKASSIKLTPVFVNGKFSQYKLVREAHDYTIHDFHIRNHFGSPKI